tara:strand:+ start:226 stop:1077 length:852 start_codon:yes stop_codon:yes gene_type:complete
MIDTLILSGGGPSGIAYIGIFKALFEKNILTKDLSGIKEIITTSVGILFSILYMLSMNEESIEKIIYQFDILSFLNTKDLDIDNLLVDFGLFDNYKIGESVNSFIRHILHIEDITLQELYDKIPIKLTVKVFNSTKKKLEYISYQSDPNLKLSLLAQMTTAIPFFFKPVEYNSCLYVDGGLRGHFPIEECKSKNYLGLFVLGGSIPKDSELLDLFPILRFIHSLMINQDDIIHEIKNGKKFYNIIYTEINQGLNFDLSESQKKEIIKKGYQTTINHIQKYFTE